MQADWFPKSFLWFLVFPMNRYLPILLEFKSGVQDSQGRVLITEEWKVALLLFVIQLGEFMLFAWGTIQ